MVASQSSLFDTTYFSRTALCRNISRPDYAPDSRRLCQSDEAEWRRPRRTCTPSWQPPWAPDRLPSSNRWRSHPNRYTNLGMYCVRYELTWRREMAQMGIMQENAHKKEALSRLHTQCCLRNSRNLPFGFFSQWEGTSVDQ